MRKLAKQLSPLRAMYRSFRARCPYTAETLERFVEASMETGCAAAATCPCYLFVSPPCPHVAAAACSTAGAHATLRLPRPATPLQIWDMFVHCSDASLGFEDRFAIFCDQLGDFLEGLVQRAVDVLELFFQMDAEDQQVRPGPAWHRPALQQLARAAWSPICGCFGLLPPSAGLPAPARPPLLLLLPHAGGAVPHPAPPPDASRGGGGRGPAAHRRLRHLPLRVEQGGRCAGAERLQPCVPRQVRRHLAVAAPKVSHVPHAAGRRRRRRGPPALALSCTRPLLFHHGANKGGPGVLHQISSLDGPHPPHPRQLGHSGVPAAS